MGSKKGRVLIAEDEEAFRTTAAEILEDAGFIVEQTSDGEEAWRRFRHHVHDVVVTDIRMPNMYGLDLLQKIIEFSPNTPVIVITAYGSLDTAVEALRRGAVDYITKPCDLDEFRMRVERAAEEVGLKRKVAALETEDTASRGPSLLLGESAGIRRIHKLIDKVAPTVSTVLITGESGTGKELVARELHKKSGLDRFVPVNCGAIPEHLMESELFGHRKGAFTGAVAHKEGFFRIADGGTLFLDEIGEMPLNLQVKLLRALDSGEIQPVGESGPMRCEPRIITATNRNLKEEVKEGRFREDLYFRLDVIEIELPPLRERPVDVAVLAKHFLDLYSARNRKPVKSITSEAMDALTSYSWKGNVRELENVIERAVILADEDQISLTDLPVAHSNVAIEKVSEGGSVDLKTSVEQFERQCIHRTLREVDGDKRAAAKRLGIGLSSFYRKLEQHDSGVADEE